jgi:hypothetical protein
VTDVTQLEEFLRRDVFSADCTPSDHIRRIEIVMRIPADDSYGGPHKREYTKFVDLLAPIFNIKRLKGLRVRLVVDCSRHKSLLRSIEKLEETLAPTIHRLHNSGAQVAWFRRDDDFEPPHTDNMPALGRDYTLSMEELTDGIAANSIFVSGRSFF